jgi:hypothetical protein
LGANLYTHGSIITAKKVIVAIAAFDSDSM